MNIDTLEKYFLIKILFWNTFQLFVQWAAHNALSKMYKMVPQEMLEWTFYTQNHHKFLPISFILFLNFQINLHFPLSLYLSLYCLKYTFRAAIGRRLSIYT